MRRHSLFAAKGCRILSLLIIGLALSPLPQAGAAAIQAYSQPQACPDFTLEDLTGKMVNIREFRGRVVILNFWATW